MFARNFKWLEKNESHPLGKIERWRDRNEIGSDWFKVPVVLMIVGLSIKKGGSDTQFIFLIIFFRSTV